MNIKEKLLEARIRLQEMNLKKSGMNKYAGYAYYELGDFLPVINKLGKEFGFVCLVSFSDFAKLEIIDVEKEDKLVFTSPMSTASLKGCHEVQNLGAVETYLKRYLYQHAFEIVECDALDSTLGKEKQNEKPAQTPTKSDAQKKCAELGDDLSLTPEERKKFFFEFKGDYEKLAEFLQSLVEKKKFHEQIKKEDEEQAKKQLNIF